jgi:hypothetical protein
MGESRHHEKRVYDSYQSDWLLIELPQRLYLPNQYVEPVSIRSNATPAEEKVLLSSCAKEETLASGYVVVLCSAANARGGFLTQSSVSLHIKGSVLSVREITLTSPLPEGSSGAWVVRNDILCGHVVALSQARMSCYMLSIEHTFNHIETVMGAEVLLDVALVDNQQDHTQRFVSGVTELFVGEVSTKIANEKPEANAPAERNSFAYLTTQASGLRETALSNNHPDTLTSMNELGGGHVSVLGIK